MGQLDGSRERESENAQNRDRKEWTGINERNNAGGRERAEVKDFGQAETEVEMRFAREGRKGWLITHCQPAVGYRGGSPLDPRRSY